MMNYHESAALLRFRELHIEFHHIFLAVQPPALLFSFTHAALILLFSDTTDSCFQEIVPKTH